MSDTTAHDLSICHWDRKDGESCRNAQEGIATDRRWTISPEVKFQKPFQPRPSTSSVVCDTSGTKPEIFRDGSVPLTRARNTTFQSKTGLRSAQLNLRTTASLSYPDLSLSSFASAREISPSIATLSLADEQASLNQDISSPTKNSTSIAISTLDEPFRSPRGFHIPKSKFENAFNSKPGSAASFWQYILYEGPGEGKETVKLHYCQTKESMEAVARKFLDEDVIGFDIEWMAQAKSTDSIKKNVALIQFACEERIALFHIARFPGPETIKNLVSPTLKKIMESPNITKVGVAIKGDCTRLKNFLDIHCRGLFELSYLHKLVQYRSGQINKVDRRNVRLADQVQEHLKLPLHKGDVQTSNWSIELDHQQTQYAASDAYAALQVFHILEAKRKAFDPVPPRPAHAELNIAISLGDLVQKDYAVEHRDDDDLDDAPSVSSSDVSIEELAREYFHISLSDGAPNTAENSNKSLLLSNGAIHPQSVSVPSASQLSPNIADEVASKEDINSPEMDIANQFVAAFKPPANRRIAPQALRAYSLWHKQGLSIPEVAARLRRPPIKHTTVFTYLCEAINLGNLDYEPKRILEFSSEYAWRPFLKAHGDLLDRARRKQNQANESRPVEKMLRTSKDDCPGLDS